jgi:hypothetical protein
MGILGLVVFGIGVVIESTIGFVLISGMPITFGVSPYSGVVPIGLDGEEPPPPPLLGGIGISISTKRVPPLSSGSGIVSLTIYITANIINCEIYKAFVVGEKYLSK